MTLQEKIEKIIMEKPAYIASGRIISAFKEMVEEKPIKQPIGFKKEYEEGYKMGYYDAKQDLLSSLTEDTKL